MNVRRSSHLSLLLLFYSSRSLASKFLPSELLAAEGGAKRRRSSVSLREVVGLEEGGGAKKKGSRVHPVAPTTNTANDNATMSNEIKED